MKQSKKETDAVTKIATAVRGRQARTLKKRMKQSNKLADLMRKKKDIPDDKYLQYFDESGQLTKKQKELADKMAATAGGKRKTRRKRKTKKRRRKSRRKTRKKRKRKTRKKRGRGKVDKKTKEKMSKAKAKAKVIPSIRKIKKPISGAKANLILRKVPLRRQSALRMFKSRINQPVAASTFDMSDIQRALPQQQTLLTIPSSDSDSSGIASDEIREIMNTNEQGASKE